MVNSFTAAYGESPLQRLSTCTLWGLLSGCGSSVMKGYTAGQLRCAVNCMRIEKQQLSACWLEVHAFGLRAQGLRLGVPGLSFRVWGL